MDVYEMTDDDVAELHRISELLTLTRPNLKGRLKRKLIQKKIDEYHEFQKRVAQKMSEISLLE